MTRVSDDLRLVANYIAGEAGPRRYAAAKLDELAARVRALEDRAGLLTAALHAAVVNGVNPVVGARLDRVLAAGSSPTVDELEAFRRV